MTASLEKFRSEFIDRETFEREVLRAYADGSAEACLPADRAVALSWMPPATARSTILTRGLRVFYLDAVKIARELAATPDLQLRMQGIVLLGIFLRVAPFVRAQGLSEPQLFEGVEKALRKYFGRRGEKVIAANLSAVKQGYFNVRELDFAQLPHAAQALRA